MPHPHPQITPQGASEEPCNSAPLSQAQGVRELPSGYVPQLPAGKRRGPEGPGRTRGGNRDHCGAPQSHPSPEGAFEHHTAPRQSLRHSFCPQTARLNSDQDEALPWETRSLCASPRAPGLTPPFLQPEQDPDTLTLGCTPGPPEDLCTAASAGRSRLFPKRKGNRRAYILPVTPNIKKHVAFSPRC